ncbi:metal-sensitive transcriptional regulator [Candidatus Woesebacteria bacterium]|nr:metal-sensitive transcriptional regulator [Candidatus Woesebacteria bacterium]
MTFKPKDTKERIVHRLKIAQGHVKKIMTMVEGDAYCIDILHQSYAVQKALKEVDSVILENHLQTCTSEAIRDGRSEEAITEVMKIFKKKQ